MFRFQRVSKWISVSLLAGLPVAWAVSPAIGFVTARGTIQLDASPVARQGTVFQGSTIQTHTTGSQLEIPKEAKMFLGADSRAQVFRDHMILEKGDTEVSGASRYWVQARGVRIGSVEANAVATISLRDKQILVTALGGEVRITNSQGVLMAQVKDGQTAQVPNQDPGTAPATPPGGAAPAATSNNGHSRSKKVGIIVGVAAVGGVAAVVGLTRADEAPISQ